jgi:predicted SnoaL-like aldol condensation-catalyzing enzyme
MSTDQSRVLARRVIDEVLNTGDMAAADDFLHPDFIEHSAPPGFPGDREGVKAVFRALHEAFPDFKYAVEETVSEGDQSSFGSPPAGRCADRS